MRIQLEKERGNVLMVTVFTTSIMGVMLAAFLTHTSNQNQHTIRSLSWNAAVPVMEAGVEEALTHLYQNHESGLGSDGWFPFGNVYFKKRDLGSSVVVVGISNVNPPVVYAWARVPIPGKTGQFAKRSVVLHTRNEGLFARGLVAKEAIVLNGNNVKVDSFDSSDPSASTGGQYDPAKRKDNGHVATNLGIVNALSTGNATIFGTVATGPGGSVGIGSNGSVGNAAWIASGAAGVQPGKSNDDMNVSFPDVSTPPAGIYLPSPGSGVPVTIGSSGNYIMSGLSGSLLIGSNANVNLLVTDAINITGQKSIEIEPGGSLNLYMSGSTTKIAGNGVVNAGGNATNFAYWGTPSNTSVSINGNGTFSGIIYAPQADLTLNGGGSGVDDVSGASVSRTARLNGNFQFHYDENLGNLFKNRPFIVTSWNEF